MAHKVPLIFLLVLVLIAPIAHAQSSDDKDYNIMTPEQPAPKKSVPAPKGKKRIGSSSPVAPVPLPPPLHYVPPPSQTVTPLPHVVPPSMYVPQTGMVLPNLPTVGGAGPGGSETSQDRALRCAHQAGVYGPAAGDPNAYIGSCFNQ